MKPQFSRKYSGKERVFLLLVLCKAMNNNITIIFYDGKQFPPIPFLLTREDNVTIITLETLDCCVRHHPLLTVQGMELCTCYFKRCGSNAQLFYVEDIDNKFKFLADSTVTEFAFYWKCKVDVRSFDTGFTSLCLIRKTLYSFCYDSRVSFQVNFQQLTTKPMMTDGPSRLVFNVRGDVVDLNETTFFSHADYGHFDCYIMKLQDCYSSPMLPQISDCVTFVKVDADPSISFLGKRTWSQGLESTILKRTRAAAPKDKNASWREGFSKLVQGKQAEWKTEVVDHAVKSMIHLNKAYLPSHSLNEASRRLIINNIVLPVCSFLNILFSVETMSDGVLGHGPLDYRFYKLSPLSGAPVVGKSKVDTPTEAGEQVMTDFYKKGLSEREFLTKEGDERWTIIYEKEGENREMIKTLSEEAEKEEGLMFLQEFRVLEAKEEFEDKDLAQMAAEMYDILREESVPAVHGFLSTGTQWLFFTMTMDEVTSSSSSLARRPATMKCVAEVNLHIIEDYVQQGICIPQRRKSAPTGAIYEKEVKDLLELFASFISQ
jgi:hypothetical protein